MAVTDYYVTTDAMGSVMAVLDETGNVLERRSYDAFGEATYMLPDGAVVPDSPTGVDIGFQGQLMDELTGMYQMGFRWYSPVLGRWVSRDPIGLEGGPSLYAMTKNNPISWSDNIGLAPQMYANQTAAAKEAIKAANPFSIKENLEKCGMVCRDRKTRKFFTTGPVTGTINRCSPGDAACPCTSTTVGYWHTHGRVTDDDNDGKDDYDSENFSRLDKNAADAIKGDGYLGTPSGRFKQYNYDPNKMASGVVIDRGKLK